MSRRIYFEATNCRNRCFHCYCPSDCSGREMMMPGQIIQTAKAFRAALGEPVTIGIMREPTLYPDLLPLLRQAEKENLLEDSFDARAIYTNGEGVTSEFLEELAPLMKHMVFTLFGTEMIHDALAGRIGAYRRIESATKLALEAGFEVSWRIMITKGSEDDLGKLVQDGIALKVSKLHLTARYFLSGVMRNAYENIPTSVTIEEAQKLGLPLDIEDMRPEREYAANPDLLAEIEIPRLHFSNLFVDRDMNVYPLNQIAEEMCIGNFKEGKNLLFDRLNGKALMPESIRRALQIFLPVLAEKYASSYSDQMLSPQMLFEKYYWKFDL